MDLAAFTITDITGPLEDTGPRAGADAGTPMTSARVLQPAAAGVPEVGVWECTPGGWPIEDRPDTEVVVVVSGAATLTPRDGAPVEIGPGDTAVLPRGWSGRWDVRETLRKVYVLS
ncbi:MAG: uncharacterized protein QOG70_1608 [Solirubrobacteraceae bacterium]|jgi:uncharacterized cupin superfamily protein|nr:uncharacterized protein [Solirubrobacteraceae bacterium]